MFENVRIVVAGAGEVGSYVAERLSREGNEVIVIDLSREQLEPLEKLDIMTVTGNATNPKTLREAGVDKAEVLVAVTEQFMSCLFIRERRTFMKWLAVKYFWLAPGWEKMPRLSVGLCKK